MARRHSRNDSAKWVRVRSRTIAKCEREPLSAHPDLAEGCQLNRPVVRLEPVDECLHSRGCWNPATAKPGQGSCRRAFSGFLPAQERRVEFPIVNTP